MLRSAHLLAQSLHVPTASVEIADPEYILIVGGPGGKTKELEQPVIENGSAGVSVRGITVDFSECTQAFMSTPTVSNATSGNVLDDHLNDTSECDVGYICTNQSKTLSSIAIWINQVLHYNFRCPGECNNPRQCNYPGE